MDLLLRLSSAGDEGVSIGELAQAAGVTSRNVTGLVDTLERDGLARRVPDRRDRRSVLAQITPEGLAWIEAFRKPSQLAMAAIFRGFTSVPTAGRQPGAARAAPAGGPMSAATREVVRGYHDARFRGDAAALVYDVHTATPAGVQRTAEHFRLRDGKIGTIMLIFDAAPWQPMAASIK